MGTRHHHPPRLPRPPACPLQPPRPTATSPPLCKSSLPPLSKRVVLLFAGQGAQTVGMGHELASAFPAARTLLDEADAVLGYSLSNVMFQGPIEELTRTSRCQPALYAHGLACLAALR